MAPTSIWLMERLLLMEAEVKSFLLRKNLSYELELKEELLEILEQVELLYGPRDRSYEMLEPRITECVYAHPTIYGPRKIRIYLTKEAKDNRYIAAIELAHEAVHTLTPEFLGKGDTILEEGLAEYFAFKYMQRNYRVQLETSGYREYDAALHAVSKLLAKNEFVIKELRVHQPVISRIDEKLLVEVAGAEPELAKFLCQDFWSYWEPPASWNARATQRAQLFTRGVQSIWNDLKSA